MPDRNDILWFKRQFAARIASAVEGTPLGVDLVVAIACQETGFIWSTLRRKRMPIARILDLCVGDTIDARPDGSGRPFPKHRADLLSHPQGAAMFAIARQALVDMAAHIPGYERSAANPSPRPRAGRPHGTRHDERRGLLPERGRGGRRRAAGRRALRAAARPARRGGRAHLSVVALRRPRRPGPGRAPQSDGRRARP